MNDFDHTLSAMFDEVAGTIQPRPDFDAVLAGRARPAPILSRSRWASRSFRHGVGVAAATAMLLGGSAFAIGAGMSGKRPTTLQVKEVVATTDGEPTKTTQPTTTHTEPATSEPITTVPPSTSVAPATTKPEPTPTTKVEPPATIPPPVVIAFTANLGESNLGGSPMVQWLYGTATPGSRIDAVTAYGSASATAGSKGGYELRLKMFEVPVGTSVGIRVTNSANSGVFEFTVTRPAPAPVDFTAEAAFTTCDSDPPFNEYWGRATAGSTVSISSPYGSEVVTADGEGHWSARIEFPEAPVGSMFVVRLTNSASATVYELPFTRTA